MAEAVIQNEPGIDYVAVKEKQQKTWGAGDYASVGATLQIVGEQLAENLHLRANQRVLDVAAGNGNFSLAAARRFTQVTSTDFVPALLEKGRIRALADGFDISYQIADAENLPFADGEFDVVASTFGVMFTPNHQQSSAEMARVVRSGGRIGLANWTPESFVGRMFKAIGQHIPNPLPSPALWGTRAHIETLFGDQASDIAITRRYFNFCHTTPETWLENFRKVYGPVKNAFAALDEEGQASLEQALLSLAHELNTADDGTMFVPGEYLEIIITRA